jgi:curved DNA-binding protein CbpA
LKDYYRTLGVLDDAEDIIIRAAYKALAQRYHPDKFKGDLTDATSRMSEINEAYDVLSDSERRKKYDAEFFKFREKDASIEDEDSKDGENCISDDDESWIIACEFFPQINDEYKHLEKINWILANTFKAIVINSQNFKSSLQIKQKIEKEYLSRYYGDDIQTQNFARRLLLLGHNKAAIKINKIVRAMGGSVNFKQIHEKIISEFPYTQEQEDFLSSKKIISKLKNIQISPKELVECFDHLFKVNGVGVKVHKTFLAEYIYKFELENKVYSLNHRQMIYFILQKLGEV